MHSSKKMEKNSAELKKNVVPEIKKLLKLKVV
jgi:hypothetical protein